VAPYYRTSKDVVVYESAFVTALGDPRTGVDLPLEPGAVVANQYIFYVPKGRFDRLRVYVIGRFTRHDEKTIPTRLLADKDGLPDLVIDNPRAVNVFTFSTYVTSLDLNGR